MVTLNKICTQNNTFFIWVCKVFITLTGSTAVVLKSMNKSMVHLKRCHKMHRNDQKMQSLSLSITN